MVLANWLGERAHGTPFGKRPAFHPGPRHDMHGDVAGSRIILYRFQYLPAAHVRQIQVQDDGFGLVLFDMRHRFCHRRR